MHSLAQKFSWTTSDLKSTLVTASSPLQHLLYAYACIYVHVYCVFSRSAVSDSFRPHGLKPARLLCPWNSPGKNTGVCCHFLLQGIFLTQGLNLLVVTMPQPMWFTVTKTSTEHSCAQPMAGACKHRNHEHWFPTLEGSSEDQTWLRESYCDSSRHWRLVTTWYSSVCFVCIISLYPQNNPMK